MGIDIVLPVVVIVLVATAVVMWAKQRFRENPPTFDPDAGLAAPVERLTSDALHTLPPPWRTVHEIAPDRLDGIAHVLIGPAGIFAVRTRMDPLPEPGEFADDPHAIGEAAIARGALDDALSRCAMSSDRLLLVQWGVSHDDHPDDQFSVEPGPGVTAVDGRRLAEWAESVPADALSTSQVDLAWQTVVTSIGRPDPLA